MHYRTSKFESPFSSTRDYKEVRVRFDLKSRCNDKKCGRSYSRCKIVKYFLRTLPTDKSAVRWYPPRSASLAKRTSVSYYVRATCKAPSSRRCNKCARDTQTRYGRKSHWCTSSRRVSYVDGVRCNYDALVPYTRSYVLVGLDFYEGTRIVLA